MHEEGCRGAPAQADEGCHRQSARHHHGSDDTDHNRCHAVAADALGGAIAQHAAVQFTPGRWGHELVTVICC